MEKTKILARDFKALIAAVCKHPSLGAFAGSDLVNFQVVNGQATAKTFGVVAARAAVSAEGLMSLIGIDRRAIEEYAKLCGEKSTLEISRDGNEIKFVCRERKLQLVVDTKVAPVKTPGTKNLPKIAISKAVAERVAYLADVAFNDSSRAELCCVMLTTDSLAIAVDQKTFAVLNIPGILANNLAVPLPLAKPLQDGDTLYIGERETIVRSGIGVYSMPSPVKAQKDFPLELIKKVGSMKREKAAVCEGEKLGNALNECAACVGGLSRTEVIVHLKSRGDSLSLTTTNGGAVFETAIPLLSCKGEFTFRVPLDSMRLTVPFFSKKVTLEQSERGDLFANVGNGWCLYPGWHESKKK